MTKVVFQSSNAERRELDVKPGTVLMRAALAENVPGRAPHASSPGRNLNEEFLRGL